jgi:adenylate kinase family enzyme
MIQEKEMTPAQMKKREEYVLKLKAKTDEFKKNYGDRWKSVMYATATKMAMKEDAPAVSTGSIPNPAVTSMGPRLKSINVTDRRRKKDKIPVLLKRFRTYMDQNG